MRFMMERDTVECMCKVAGLLAQIKGKVAEHIKPDNPGAYTEIRDLLGDCQGLLALHCDAAPIRLISGDVDDIMANLDFSKETVPEGV